MPDGIDYRLLPSGQYWLLVANDANTTIFLLWGTDGAQKTGGMESTAWTAVAFH